MLNESLNVVCEVMEVALESLAWMLVKVYDSEEPEKKLNCKKEVAEEDFTLCADDASADDSDASNEDHEDNESATILISIRDGIVALSKNIFSLVKTDEGSVNDDEEEEESPLNLFISDTQEVSMKIVSDLRSLLHKSLSDASSQTLRSLALTDDGQLAGAMMRYVKDQDRDLKMLKEEGGGEEEEELFVMNCLAPQARAVLGNFKAVNRREAGNVLSHFTGTSANASELVKVATLFCKKKDSVKLLEVHMASLRQGYEAYLSSSVGELAGSKFTDDELGNFSQREKSHKESFSSLVKLSARLAKSLGVAEIKDKNMKESMGGFVKEAVRYAFSVAKKDGNKKEEDQEAFGRRVNFLALLKIYVGFVKKDKAKKEEILGEFESCEKAFREHLFYDEDKHGEHLKVGKDFLSNLGAKKRAAPAAVVSDGEGEVEGGGATPDSDEDEFEKNISNSKRGAGAGAGAGAAGRRGLDSVMEMDGEDDATTRTGSSSSAGATQSSKESTGKVLAAPKRRKYGSR